MRQRTFVHFEHPLYTPFNSLARELDRELFREDNRNFSAQAIHETEEAFLMSFDIPGVQFSDINIDLEEDKLTISADRKNPFDFEKKGEPMKKYRQTFVLPKNIEQEKINAHYENGVLSLTLPKMIETKMKKKIQVLTGDKPKVWTNFLGFGKASGENAVS